MRGNLHVISLTSSVHRLSSTELRPRSSYSTDFFCHLRNFKISHVWILGRLNKFPRNYLAGREERIEPFLSSAGPKSFDENVKWRCCWRPTCWTTANLLFSPGHPLPFRTFSFRRLFSLDQYNFLKCQLLPRTVWVPATRATTRLFRTAQFVFCWSRTFFFCFHFDSSGRSFFLPSFAPGDFSLPFQVTLEFFYAPAYLWRFP